LRWRSDWQGFTETDSLRVLDHNGHRVFNLFTWDELGTPIVHEGPLDDLYHHG
jgi:hypothetical protein